MNEEKTETPKAKKSCFVNLCNWIGSPSFYIYTNFFLGAWGDRMWAFSVGMYLVVLSEGLLRLAAIYGLCSGCCVLLFGGIIGDWVDRNERLKVVSVSLFIQNTSVMLSAIAVSLTLYYEEQIDTYWDHGLKAICEMLIVTLAIVATLASTAYKIAIEKDWIVVIAGTKMSKLTNLNAVIRAIDLSCKVLAPTCAGLIMSFASLFVSALVIAAWNLVSVVVEYLILSKVFYMVPELADKKKRRRLMSQKSADDSANEVAEKEKLTGDIDKEEQDQDIENPDKDEKGQEEVPLRDNKNNKTKASKRKRKPSAKSMDEKPRKSTVEIMFSPCIVLFKSWRVYIRQKVVFAGLSLSLLFMTVLGFDSITVGFIYANGVSELAVGLSMAGAGVTGIIGTFIFTRLRPRIGLERTGLIAYMIEVALLSLCVMSVFAPGSPFVPNYRPSPKQVKNNNCSSENGPSFDDATVPILDTTNFTDPAHNISKRDLWMFESSKAPWIFTAEHGYTVDMVDGFAEMGIGLPDTETIQMSSLHYVDLRSLVSTPATDDIIDDTDKQYHVLSEVSQMNSAGHRVNNVRLVKRDVGDTLINTTEESQNSTDCDEPIINEIDASVILLIIGIVASRVGLWMADLTVTQLLQENVPENERGAVGGVQNSLNKTFDLLKFIVVIFVPYIETFGYLIIMSFTFVSLAGCLFAFHAYRVRGYLFYCCHSGDKQGKTLSIENGKSAHMNGHKDVVIVENEKEMVDMKSKRDSNPVSV